MRLARLVELGRTIRVIGFDDAPFPRKAGARVWFSGVVCSDTVFEGMLWGHVRRDGWTATQTLANAFNASKYRGQVRLVLLDGIALGGFNVIDLAALARETALPCVAVMRKAPDLGAVRRAIARLPDPPRRLKLLERAGEIYAREGRFFQVQGCAPEVVARALPRLCSHGHVPEALRLAHHVGTAVITGQSGRRA